MIRISMQYINTHTIYQHIYNTPTHVQNTNTHSTQYQQIYNIPTTFNSPTHIQHTNTCKTKTKDNLMYCYSMYTSASATFGRLHANVWNRRGISLQTKLKVYRAIVLPTLLYACETWTVYQRHAKKLNHFHTTCLRKLLNIKWQDRIPYTEVLAQADLHLYHPNAVPAMLGRTRSPHARPSAPKKAILLRITARKTVTWRTEEALQIHSKNIPESVCHHPQLLGTNRYGPGYVAFLRAQRLQDMQGQQDRCSRVKEASQESPSQQSSR